MLILPERRGTKQSNDLLYVFDTLTIFADALSDLCVQAPALVPTLSAKTQSKIKHTVAKLCFVESDVSRGAATMAAEQRNRPPDSAQIVGGCEVGLRRVLARAVSFP